MSDSLNNPFSVAVSDRSSDTSLQSRQTTMGRYVELSIVQRVFSLAAAARRR